jgi:hypothetical protein
MSFAGFKGVKIPMAILISIAACACNTPCDDVAAQICARTGDNDLACAAMRKHAAAPTAADLQACKAGVAFAHELGRAR